MVPVDFFVAGTPVTQGSKNAFVNRHTGRAHMVEKGGAGLAAWRHAIASEARRVSAGRPPFDGPVVVCLAFGLQRPASHPKTRRTWPCQARSGDVDKLARAALDAITGVLVADDAQVVGLSVTKTFSRPGVRLMLWPELADEGWVPEWQDHGVPIAVGTAS